MTRRETWRNPSPMRPDADPVIRRAIAAIGSHREFAQRLGIKAPSLHVWREIPSKRVLDIERITKIPRYELRPDLYPPPRQRRRAATKETSPGCVPET